MFNFAPFVMSLSTQRVSFLQEAPKLGTISVDIRQIVLVARLDSEMLLVVIVAAQRHEVEGGVDDGKRGMTLLERGWTLENTEKEKSSASKKCGEPTVAEI